jgi:hypothetical protein
MSSWQRFFSRSVGCLFILVMVSFAVQKLFIFLLIFLWYCGLNSGPCSYWSGALPLEPYLQPRAEAFFFFFQYWGLNSGTSPWVTPPALFLWRVFRDGVSQTICPGWLQTAILLISASQIVRITGMSHQLLAQKLFNLTQSYLSTPAPISWAIQESYTGSLCLC